MGLRVFGIAGKARHGKDFCANIICDIAWREFGQIVIKWSLADLLKVRVYGEADGRYTLEDVFINKPPEIRNLLQQVGTERGRDVFGEDFWTRQAHAVLYLLQQKAPFIQGIVVPDVRFPNEVEFVRLNGRVLQDIIPGLRARAVRHVDFTNHYRPVPMDVAERDGAVLQCVSSMVEDEFSDSLGRCAYVESDRPTLTGDAANHPSETALDGLDKAKEFDYIITNNLTTTEEDLRNQLRPMVREWLGRNNGVSWKQGF